ncbi:hypothetical protein Q214_02027, partial [Staphylococcus aureus M1220]
LEVNVVLTFLLFFSLKLIIDIDS